jgi:UDP-N-acetylmuramate dehydrogenase
VGGAAALFVRPADREDLSYILRLAREFGQPVTILGGGANTVIGDAGVPGITLKLRSDEPENIRDLGDSIEAEVPAGAPSARLVQVAREHGLLGAEWAAGIPGTIGGLTAMNAGTRVGEMKDVVTEAFLCGPEGGAWVPASTLHFAYRHSELAGRVVARVRCRLKKGKPAEVAASLAAMEADRAYRKRTQPLNLPNSGSVFRNPPGDHAGRLVEAAGLKGMGEGGARISPQHANFIVNEGGATAKDVTTLMARMQRAVRERFQIPLALEVRLVGSFVPSADVLGLVIDQ